MPSLCCPFISSSAACRGLDAIRIQAQQRMQHAQREKDRFHQALMKSFRYIAQKQDETLQRQLLQIERIKAHERQLYELRN